MRVKSLRNGHVYDINPSGLQEFYDNEVMGAGPCARFTGEVLNISGTVLCVLTNRHGKIIDARMGPNLVTNVGKDWVVDRIQSLTGTPALPDYQAIGTGTNAAAAGDTTLQTEIGTRTQGTLSQPTSTTDRLVTTYAAGNGTGAITETGRLTASSGGTLVARQVFSVINKGASDSLTITHDLTIS